MLQLRAFVAVGSGYGSFTLAAEALHRTQPGDHCANKTA